MIRPELNDEYRSFHHENKLYILNLLFRRISRIATIVVLVDSINN